MKNRIHFTFLILFWIVMVFISLWWNVHSINNEMLEHAKITGKSIFNEIQNTRLWNARHGGVYVPVTETTQPNPYLEDPDRDIITSVGILTKVNPAFMTRQIAEIAEKVHNIRYHITSLNPIRPGNLADEWEATILKQFEKNPQDYLEYIPGKSQYRYMAPLVTEESCLNCHDDQGYKVGDIRGGISVVIPAMPYLASAQSIRSKMTVFHMGVLILGLCILTLFNTLRSNQEKKIKEKNRELKAKIQENEYTTKILEKSFLELSSAMNASEDAIYILDLEGRILRANSFFYEITNTSPEQALGKNISEIIHKKGKSIHCPICKARENLEDLQTVLEADHLNNPTERPIEVTVKVIRDIDNEPLSLYISMHDLTNTRKDAEEKQRLEEQLRQAHKMEAIGTMAGGIAHDFNNLLTPIVGYAELAKLEKISDESELHIYIEEILNAGYRARDLVKNILSFSRKTEEEKAPLNLHPIMKEAVKLLRATIPTIIDIQTNLDKFSGNILGNPTQIHQILINLCTNSAHAMEENGGVLSISMRAVNLSENDIKNQPEVKPGSFIEIEISDTGEGIKQEIIDRIFEPYFTTKDIDKGSGMGLTIVHGIVKSHEGFIRLESTIGKGTTFHIYLPMIDVQEVQEPEEVEPMPMGEEHILVIDDEYSVALVASKLLEWLGYTVTAMTDSVEALEAFRTQPDRFDLVLTDQTMPEMTGEQLTREMIRIRPDIPIVICTGYTEKIDEESAKEAGAKAFLSKPLEHHKLAKTVREILGNSKN